MLNEGIVVTRITEDRTIDDQGKGVPFLRVEFKVDRHGPFVEKFDKASYTADVRDARLNAFALEVR